MRRIPKNPYLHNILQEYRRRFPLDEHTDLTHRAKHYTDWVEGLGLKFPIIYDEDIIIPDTMSDENLALFIMRWS